MAKIKNASKPGICTVFEDPRPGKNTIYFDHDAYDKTTLAPIFGAHLKVRGASEKTAALGYNTSSNYTRHTDVNGYSLRAGSPMNQVLAGETMYCWHYEGANGVNSFNNVQYEHQFCIDPTVPSSYLNRFTDADGNELIIWSEQQTNYNWTYVHTWYNVPADKELYEVNPTQIFGYTGTTAAAEILMPTIYVHKDPNSDYMAGISVTRRLTAEYRPWIGISRNSFNNHSSGAANYDLTRRNPYWVQFIGANNSDLPLYLYTDHDSDYIHYITRLNYSSNNTTDLHSFTAAPAASGTSTGGARVMNTTMAQMPKFSSKHFEDPASAGNRVWYTPYFDTSYNYHPWVFKWDKTTDVFTRAQATSITGDLSSNHMLNLAGTNNDTYGFRGVVWNESFVSGGNRYLTLMYIAGEHRIHDSPTAADARTWITYSVDAADATLLTHHSTVTIPETAKNAMFLNDTKTLLGVMGADAFYFYSWDNVNGLELSSTLADKFYSVGRDSTGRIVATAQRNDADFLETHIITPSIPVRITITPALSSYNYTGSNISSTVAVSAYNISGERIAVAVALSIDGSTMTFTGAATSTTVTTSTSADVNVDIIITGSGLSDIIANVSV